MSLNRDSAGRIDIDSESEGEFFYAMSEAIRNYLSLFTESHADWDESYGTSVDAIVQESDRLLASDHAKYRCFLS